MRCYVQCSTLLHFPREATLQALEMCDLWSLSRVRVLLHGTFRFVVRLFRDPVLDARCGLCASVVALWHAGLSSPALHDIKGTPALVVLPAL